MAGSIQVNQLNINLDQEILRVLSKTGEKCSSGIQRRSPRGYSGKYAAGWTSEVDENEKSVTVGNDGEHSSLSHLIELGHRTRSGSNVAPQEHIRPEYNTSKQFYLNEMQKIEIRPR